MFPLFLQFVVLLFCAPHSATSIQEGQLLVTGESMGTQYWLTALFYVHGKHLKSCRDSQLT